MRSEEFICNTRPSTSTPNSRPTIAAAWINDFRVPSESSRADRIVFRGPGSRSRSKRSLLEALAHNRASSTANSGMPSERMAIRRRMVDDSADPASLQARSCLISSGASLERFSRECSTSVLRWRHSRARDVYTRPTGPKSGSRLPILATRSSVPDRLNADLREARTTGPALLSAAINQQKRDNSLLPRSLHVQPDVEALILCSKGTAAVCDPRLSTRR